MLEREREREREKRMHRATEMRDFIKARIVHLQVLVWRHGKERKRGKCKYGSC